jgi:hypothetical protein
MEGVAPHPSDRFEFPAASSRDSFPNSSKGNFGPLAVPVFQECPDLVLEQVEYAGREQVHDRLVHRNVVS